MSSGLPRYAVDANVILRFLLRDDEALAARAFEVIEAADEGRIVLVCDPVTLAEVVYVMVSVYQLANAEIGAALIAFLQPDGVILAEKDRYLRALRLFAETVPHFGDACACAAAQQECGGRLLSFDRKLSSVAGIERSEAPPDAGG